MRGRNRGNFRFVRGSRGPSRPDKSTFINRGAIVDRRFSNGSVLSDGSSSSTIQNETVFQSPHPFQRRPPPVQEFPQDKRFFCDKCFYGYDYQNQYDNHLKTHIKCTQEGCKFESNVWTMAKHTIKMHSLTIGKGSQASDERWVNERKRKFPSNSVIAAKHEDEKLKTNRGEIIVAKNSFGRFKIDESNDFKRNLVGDETESTETFLEPDNDDALPEKIRSVLNKNGQSANKFKRNNVDEKQNASLLEMLLQDDIVHERNVLYQCIRYIVHNNFFDKKQSNN